MIKEPPETQMYRLDTHVELFLSSNLDSKSTTAIRNKMRRVIAAKQIDPLGCSQQ